MWTSRLFGKIFAGYALLAIVLASVPLFVIASWQEDFVQGHVRAQLLDTALVLRDSGLAHFSSATDDALQQSLQAFSRHSETRLTIIAKDGTVLADSHESPANMENHLERQEIQQSLQTRAVGSSVRRSATLGLEQLYVSVPIERDGVLLGFARAAREVETIRAEVWSIQRRIGLVILPCLILATVTSLLLVDRTLRPFWSLFRTLAAKLPEGSPAETKALVNKDISQLGELLRLKQEEQSARIVDLQETNQRLASVMENMEEGVVAVDGDARVLLANDASRRLLEFAIPEPIGRPLWELTRNRALLDLVNRAIASSEPCQEEIEPGLISRKVLTVRARRLGGQGSDKALLVLHDISELRRLESLRRDFVANVSHELKTPLASIKAFAETLRLGAIHDPDNNLLFLGRIEEQADRLHELIMDLLQLARVESGREAFEITAVPVEDTIRSCAAAFLAGARAKGIDLAVKLPDDPRIRDLAVEADMEGLRTILNNLIDNALKYTPQGGRISIRWHQLNDQVIIEVDDTGIGIPSAHQSRIFERFYRVDKARSRALGGTGLGLSIVKHLSQSFGGNVSVESSPRQGSTFRVTLRCASDDLHT